MGNFTDHTHGLQVTVQGKQGQRSVTLIPSVPYVRRWLDDHSGNGDPEAPMWSKITKNEGLTDRMVYKLFQEAAARAWDVDIDEHGIGALPKPVTLTNFRKSSASHLASKGMNQAHIEDHHGWVRGSKVASRYVSVFSDDSDRALVEAYGKEVEEGGDDATIARLTVPGVGPKLHGTRTSAYGAVRDSNPARRISLRRLRGSYSPPSRTQKRMSRLPAG